MCHAWAHGAEQLGSTRGVGLVETLVGNLKRLDVLEGHNRTVLQTVRYL